MAKLIMTFQIFLDREGISEMRGPYGAVTMLPFTGRVESDLFTGEILPGGVDVQVENPAGCRNMCAKYMFKGKDSAGQECYLFVENNGYYAPAKRDGGPIEAYPRFLTDSLVLGEYISQQRFRSEVHGREYGVDIQIYDVIADVDTKKNGE